MGGDHRGSHLVVTQDPLTPTLSRQGRGYVMVSRLLRYARNDRENGGKAGRALKNKGQALRTERLPLRKRCA